MSDEKFEEQGHARIEFIHGPCFKYVNVPFDKDKDLDFLDSRAFLDEHIHRLFSWVDGWTEAQVTFPNGTTHTYQIPLAELLASVIRNIASEKGM